MHFSHFFLVSNLIVIVFCKDTIFFGKIKMFFTRNIVKIRRLPLMCSKVTKKAPHLRCLCVP